MAKINLKILLGLAISLSFEFGAYASISCANTFQFETVHSMQAKGILPEVSPGSENDYLRERNSTLVKKWNDRLAGKYDKDDRRDRQVNSNFPIDRTIREVLQNIERFRFTPESYERWDDHPPFPFVKAEPGSLSREYKIDSEALLKSWSGKHILDLGAGNFLTALTILNAFSPPADQGGRAMAETLGRAQQYFREHGYPRISGFSLVDMNKHQSEGVPVHILELGRNQVFVPPAVVRNTRNLNPLVGRFYEEVSPQEVVNDYGLAAGGYDSQGVFRYTENAPHALANLAKTLAPGSVFIIDTGSAPDVKMPDGTSMDLYKYLGKYGKGFKVFTSTIGGNSSGFPHVLIRTEEEFYLPPMALEGNRGFAPHWVVLQH